MKVLVTGGAGYKGSVLVEHLLRLQEVKSVTVYDNFRFNQVSLLHLFSNEKLTLVRADVRSEQQLLSQLKAHDVIIPLACLTGAPLCDQFPEEAKAVNLTTIQFIAKSIASDQLLLFPMTNSGYGIGANHNLCDELSPLHPVSSYGRWKVEAEAAVMSRANSCSFRFATLFGVSQRMRFSLLVHSFCRDLYLNRFLNIYEPQFRRNFLHVQDAARLYCWSLLNWSKLKGQIVNVGLDSANMDKASLAKLIQSCMPFETKVVHSAGTDPDQRDYLVSNKKLNELGFFPSTPLPSGIKEVIRFLEIFSQNQSILLTQL